MKFRLLVKENAHTNMCEKSFLIVGRRLQREVFARLHRLKGAPVLLPYWILTPLSAGLKPFLQKVRPWLARCDKSCSGLMAFGMLFPRRGRLSWALQPPDFNSCLGRGNLYPKSWMMALSRSLPVAYLLRHGICYTASPGEPGWSWPWLGFSQIRIRWLVTNL